MPESRPNVIFIITDQQRFDSIRSLGFPHMETPNLDRLVNEGVTFSNCFVTAPSCAPARASLFTGHYPHTTGVLKNADKWQHSWVENLQAAGYHTVNVGKMHTFPYDTPLGFKQRFVVENKDRFLEGRYFTDEWDKAIRARGLTKPGRVIYREMPDYRERLGAIEWSLPDELHSDMFVGDMACWWIENYPNTEPLFLEIGFPGPHPPYDPIPRYTEHYMKQELPLLEVTDAEIAAQPPALQGMIQHNCGFDHDSVVHLRNPTHEQRHRQRAYYLANVTMIDEKVGEILNSLEKQGYLGNSVVIFASDHGDCLTDHGHSQKWTMYDAVTRVPMIVWAPGRFEGGRIVDGLCQLMDIGPAILELAEAEIPDPIEARSMLPALRSEPWEGRQYVFAEQARDVNLTTTDFMTMVRGRDWKLVHFLDEPHGQLFHLADDPDEVKDLWNEPAAQDKKRELLDVLREWRIGSQYRTSSWGSEWR